MAILITGAAGFIGHRLALRLLEQDHDLILLDNFSRRGSRLNAEKLSSRGVNVVEVDITDFEALSAIFSRKVKIETIFHLAAQVAVTTSYENPFADFHANAVGSFNLAEATRLFHPEAHIVYASTNKVFGSRVFDVPVCGDEPANPYSPYGVSKYIGDLYLREYRRKEFGISSSILRQSCIYGPGQMGVEDQGWVAWFLLANCGRKPVTIYGDGQQVRDLLYIDDLIDLYLRFHESRVNGEFVVGGGPETAASVNEVIQKITSVTGRPFSKISSGESRPGDQPYFVADITILHDELGWKPTVYPDDGISRLYSWITENLGSLSREGLA